MVKAGVVIVSVSLFTSSILAACGGSPQASGGSISGPIYANGTLNQSAAASTVAAFSQLDDVGRRHAVASLDESFGREFWTVNGLETALGGKAQADKAYASLNAVVRAAGTKAIGRTTIGRPSATVSRAGVRGDGDLAEARGGALLVAAVLAGQRSDKPMSGDLGGGITGTASPHGMSITVSKDNQWGVEMKLETTNSGEECPDASGHVQLRGTLSAMTSKAGVGGGWSGRIAVDVQLNDNADIVSQKSSGMTASLTDFKPGKGSYVEISQAADGSYVVDRQGGVVSDEFTAEAVTTGLYATTMLSSGLVTEARKKWEGGKCVTLQTTVSAGPEGLDPKAPVTIVAMPRAVLDNAPAGGTVKATLDGASSVEPSGTPVNADATFHYVAPPEVEQVGTVALEARPRRGIARASVRLSTYALSYVASGGLGDVKIDQAICNIKKPFDLKSDVGVTMHFTPTSADGGSYTVSGTTPGPVTWSGGGTYRVTVDQAGKPSSIQAPGTVTIAYPYGGSTLPGTPTFTLREVANC